MQGFTCDTSRTAYFYGVAMAKGDEECLASRGRDYDIYVVPIDGNELELFRIHPDQNLYVITVDHDRGSISGRPMTPEACERMIEENDRSSSSLDSDEEDAPGLVDEYDDEDDGEEEDVEEDVEEDDGEDEEDVEEDVEADVEEDDGEDEEDVEEDIEADDEADDDWENRDLLSDDGDVSHAPSSFEDGIDNGFYDEES